MLFLQSVRLAADRPHVWVYGAGWSWDWLWPKAPAWSGFSVTTESAWKQISTQVALTARTCQWGMLNASRNKTRQTGPATCPSLIYSVHSFTLFSPPPSVSFIQPHGQQVRSLSTPGERQIPEEECNKALSLAFCPSLSFSLSVCVCAVAGWAVLQSLPNKLVHTQRKQTMPINPWDIDSTDSTDFGFFLESDWTVDTVQNLCCDFLSLIVISKKWFNLWLHEKCSIRCSKCLWHHVVHRKCVCNCLFLENATAKLGQACRWCMLCILHYGNFISKLFFFINTEWDG